MWLAHSALTGNKTCLSKTSALSRKKINKKKTERVWIWMRYFSQRLQLAASVPVKPEQGVQVSQRAKPKAAPQDSPASLAHVERTAEGSCSDNAHIQDTQCLSLGVFQLFTGPKKENQKGRLGYKWFLKAMQVCGTEWKMTKKRSTLPDNTHAQAPHKIIINA